MYTYIIHKGRQTTVVGVGFFFSMELRVKVKVGVEINKEYTWFGADNSLRKKQKINK